jgi:hypothetical protein
MKLICSVLAMVLLAGRLDLFAQIPAPRGTRSSVAYTEASLDVVDANTLARIHKALHAPYSDRRLAAVPAQSLRAQPTLRSRNGTVVDEVGWGAAIGALVPAGQLFFGCFSTTEPDLNTCNKATTLKYISIGAGIGALAGLVVGIWKER